ncbi:metallophosphoesterase [Candidatus Poriferisodalis sp.]|uniref:metallophosphoesterase n=1 Tax=Candidatus Poriferisodalis sp. TaxID=3101277 RepID=UPI003B52EFCE
MPECEPYEFTTEHARDDVAALSPDAMGEVLVVGDIHGTETLQRAAIEAAVDLGAGAIVQVGDFWLSDRHWSRHGPNQASFMWTAHDSPAPIIVIDGNHEAWPTLAICPFTQAGRAAMASRRPLHLGGSIWWAWRGSVWRWGGCAFGALAGAVSPDRREPSVRHWRWPEEGKLCR